MLRRLIPIFLLAALMAGVAVAQTPEVQVARVKYGGGGDWYTGERKLVELLAFVRATTLLEVPAREDVAELTNDKLFQYAYLYLTGHGNVVFTDAEAERLRRYLTGGGFLHIDDDYGLDPNIRREMRKVFPDQEFVELPHDHPVYHIHYAFPNGLPKIHEHDGKPPQGFGMFHEGRLVVFYSYESDLGNGWEPAEVHGNPPEVREKALRMGTNLLVYALTR
jgi:hypothetical protein